MSREPLDIRFLREVAARWPLARGRGLPLRARRKRIERADFPLGLGRGMAIEPELDDWMVRWALVGGHHRDEGFRFSLGILASGDFVLDVGANIGLWSLLAAARVGSAGAVWAFEPFDANADRLERNAAISGGVPQLSIRRTAVGEADGHIALFEPAAHNSGLGGGLPREGSGDATELPSQRLDSAWKEAARRRVAVLKVDVEGAEAKVFRGATEMLADELAPIVVFEHVPAFAEASGADPGEPLEVLREHGYSIFALARGQLVALPETTPKQSDLVALKPAHERLSAVVRALR